jgi:hypothetical protein
VGFVLFFLFFYLINHGGQQTVMVNWSFKVTFGQWQLAKLPPLIVSARHGNVLCSSDGRLRQWLGHHRPLQAEPRPCAGARRVELATALLLSPTTALPPRSAEARPPPLLRPR